MQSPHDEVVDINLADAAPPNTTRSTSGKKQRFQACIACRATKTKCLPSTRQGSCQACLKASRPCIMPGPAKPRMKSAQKFSELEKKIEMLSTALAGKEQSTQQEPAATLLSTIIASDELSPPDHHDRTLSKDTNAGSAVMLTGLLDEASKGQHDIISEGLLDEQMAKSLVKHWAENMRCFIPLVLTGPRVDFDRLRETRPVLFLAIITVASSSIYPSLANRLATRLKSEIGQQIFVHDVQSVDLIFATLLFSQYYFQPGDSANLTPSQYIYSAVAMTSDLSLHIQAKSPTVGYGTTAIDALRICWSEWYAASVTAMFVHRSPLVKYPADLEKLLNLFQFEHQPSGKWLLNLLELQKIMEGAAQLIDTSENKSGDAFDHPSMQYKINILEQQLQSWEHALPEDVDHRLKQFNIHTAYLRVHEIAIRCFIRKFAPTKQRADKSTSIQEDGLMGLTPPHFDCLMRCIGSIKAAFDTYISFELSLVRCLPNSYLFWNITLAIFLIKLAHFGDVVMKNEHKGPGYTNAMSRPTFHSTTIYYLDTIAAKMDQASQGGYFPQAKPFITVLRKLKPYYLQKRAVCIHPRDGAFAIDERIPEHECELTNESANVHTGSPNEIHSNQHRPSPHQFTQSIHDSHSYNGQTPSTTVSSVQIHTPPMITPYVDQFRTSDPSMIAAYDPNTYASTDWTNFVLDEETIQQLDSFMWSEEDTAWMQSLL